MRSEHKANRHSEGDVFEEGRIGMKTLETAAGLSGETTAEIADSLRHLLADVFCIYMKTKSFHWHMTGPQFRDYHLLLDEHAERIFSMSDDIAERARKIGAGTLRSIGDISRNQRLEDNNAESALARGRLWIRTACAHGGTTWRQQVSLKCGLTRRNGARGS